MSVSARRPVTREAWSKVPEIGRWSWTIAVLATAVGGTAADLLATTLRLGLTNTLYLTTPLLVTALTAQIWSRRYEPTLYWLTVVLMGITGTLITDRTVDVVGVSLLITIVLLALALAATCSVWFASERVLSVQSVLTPRREGFYWAAILCTFALGTAASDLVAEHLGIGYGRSAVVFAAALGLVAVAATRLRLDAVGAFWAACILSRPLGASLGDYLSRQRAEGGLGLGAMGTTAMFLTTTCAVVLYLTRSGRDQAAPHLAVGAR
jgi:uncharacterized membrane-anchored protein